MKIFFTILIVFIALDVLIVVYVVLRRSKKRLPSRVIEEIKNNWRKIIRQNDHRHAVMDADKLLDYALGKMGYKGNLGNKLKEANAMFKNVNGVWSAHKVRNNIAHQINYDLSEKAYKTAMMNFKQAFKDLKIF